MKNILQYTIGIAAASLVLPAAADTIYSGLLDTAIPTDFTGTTVTIAGGTLNPFFGGVGVANNDLLQPFRTGTGDLDTLLNLGAGSTLDAGSLYLSTGYGGSQDHLGTTFTAGSEGYLGFKLNGANYGWMRVVFTDNTAGALIKDWAYDDSGAAIVVGGVQQIDQDILLSSDLTLGSQLSGTTNVVKSGPGTTTTLTGSNTYTGTTTVSSGTLSLAPGASLDNTSSVSVAAGATLAGSGTIAGATTISGIVAPGNSIGTLNIGANVTWVGAATAGLDTDWQYELGLPDTADLLTIDGQFLKDSGTGGNFRFDFMNSTDTGTFKLVSWTGTTDFSAGDFSYTNLGGGNSGTFDISGSQLNFTVVPEPGAALLGGLGLLALLRRKRHA